MLDQADGPQPGIGITVLGMHRAGTSLLAQLLVTLGCDAPRTLIGTSAHNAQGYWESRPVQQLNDRILASAGSRWDDWRGIDAGWHASVKAGEFLAEATDVLRAEFETSRLFVLKDPRISRLAPLWWQALRAVGAAPHVVVALRNPLEVAASLADRDGTPPEIAHLIWLRHMLDAEAASRGLPRVFVSYDAVLRNWGRVATGVGAGLAVNWPRSPGQIGSSGESVVRDSLRHHRHDRDEVNDNPALPAWLRRSHAILSDWADSGESEDQQAELDAIRTALDTAVPAFGPLVAAGQRSAGAAHAAERRVAKLESIKIANEGEIESGKAKRDRLLAELTEARQVALHLREAESALAQRRAELEDTQRAIADLRERLMASETEARSNAQITADLRRTLDALMTDMRSQSDRQGRLIESHAADLRAKEALLTQRAGEIAELSRLLHAAETGQEEAVARLQAETARLQAEAERQAARAVRAEAERHDTQTILGALNRAQSRFWRPRHVRLRRQMQAVQATGLFDPVWYLGANPDVAAAGINPLRHYVTHGFAENRRPNGRLADPDELRP
jgi:hypothetical protein